MASDGKGRETGRTREKARKSKEIEGTGREHRNREVQGGKKGGRVSREEWDEEGRGQEVLE